MSHQPFEFAPGVTVLGNLAVDVINAGERSPGGCASFSGVALEASGGRGRIVALAADKDRSLFAPLLSRFRGILRILSADRTSSFRQDYVDVDPRRMSVDAIGPVWGAPEIEAADPHPGDHALQPARVALARLRFRPVATRDSP